MNEFHIIGYGLPEAYHKSLIILEKLGEESDCADWGCKQKEISVTIEVLKLFKEPMISKCFIGGAADLQQYVMEMLDGILDFEVEKGNWAYTYHQRYTDQIPFIIEELKRNPGSRRAVMMIRDKSDIGSEDPACLQHIQYFIRDGKLYCKVLFRSNDACKAAFMNMFALIMLQKRIADALGVEVGSYTHRANSYHCYEKDFELLKQYVKRILDQPLPNVTYEYEGDWKELMEDETESILQKVEELKRR